MLSGRGNGQSPTPRQYDVGEGNCALPNTHVEWTSIFHPREIRSPYQSLAPRGTAPPLHPHAGLGGVEQEASE